jgi:endonuclease YncB( thermonuclease family)
LLLLALLLALPSPSSAGTVAPGREGESGFVEKAVDGDTLRVRLPSGVERVRLVGIDAPEVNHPDRGKDPYADQSTALLKALVRGKTVRLAADREDRDRHGRLLRYVYVEGPDGRWLLANLEMVRRGGARAYRRFPHSLEGEFVRAEEEARRGRRGLWAPEVPPVRPPAPAIEIPWERAGEHAGERVTVTGTIVAAKRLERLLFLNFHPEYRTHLSLVVLPREISRFPAGWERTVEGRKVRTTGTVTLHKGRPQIVLRAPEQVEILP